MLNKDKGSEKLTQLLDHKSEVTQLIQTHAAKLADPSSITR